MYSLSHPHETSLVVAALHIVASESTLRLPSANQFTQKVDVASRHTTLPPGHMSPTLLPILCLRPSHIHFTSYRHLPFTPTSFWHLPREQTQPCKDLSHTTTLCWHLIYRTQRSLLISSRAHRAPRADLTAHRTPRADLVTHRASCAKFAQFAQQCGARAINRAAHIAIVELANFSRNLAYEAPSPHT